MTDANYNTGEPQPLGTIEWTGYRFSELNDQDLFYFEENPNTDQNPSFRKISDTEALDLKNRRVLEVKSGHRVFQKEY
tara:strand:+ start:384 stop:617 length:234 start_codon:yes stop_codon:yes gene_type:complete